MRCWVVGVVAMAACRWGFDAVPDARVPDAPTPNYCARVPALAAAPAIDGVLEPGLVLQTLVPVGWQSDVTPLPAIPDVPVQFAIGYRADGLYFYIDVTDPDRYPAPTSDLAYCGDGIELYVDHDGTLSEAPAFDTAGAMQFIARAPATNTESRSDLAERYVMTAPSGAWQGGFAAFPHARGYAFEAFLTASSLSLADWTLTSGGRVGLDIGINVSRSDGAVLPNEQCAQNVRLGQFYLRIDETAIDTDGGAPWALSTAFCIAELD